MEKNRNLDRLKKCKTTEKNQPLILNKVLKFNDFDVTEKWLKHKDQIQTKTK